MNFREEAEEMLEQKIDGGYRLNKGITRKKVIDAIAEGLCEGYNEIQEWLDDQMGLDEGA